MNNNSDGSALSVVAVYFDTLAGGSADNSFIQDLITTNTSTTIVNGKITWLPKGIEVEDLLNKLDGTKILNYMGSLTTPTCAEIVEWNVINDPQPISPAQLNFFKTKWASNKTFAAGRGNNRAVQPIGSRVINYYSGPAPSSVSGYLHIAVFSTLISLAGLFFY